MGPEDVGNKWVMMGFNKSHCQIALSCHNHATPKVHVRREDPCARHRRLPGSFLGCGSLDYRMRTRVSKVCWPSPGCSSPLPRSSCGDFAPPPASPTTVWDSYYWLVTRCTVSYSWLFSRELTKRIEDWCCGCKRAMSAGRHCCACLPIRRIAFSSSSFSSP